ncbi:MAG TPA: hypothetical protein VH370_11475 [Humisphaera sp.]|jgi:hypothetical protein|nr:hypothetical protein [Humisphaera sp.]
MVTNRQIERLWTAKGFTKLYQELVASRPESGFELQPNTTEGEAAAALAMIRLDELSQSYLPLYSRLIRAILCKQQDDGGWGDLPTTALCLRALLAGNGDGLAIERGLEYLASLQKEEGIWPAAPIRRLPEDPRVSLFILYQLGDHPRFRAAVDFSRAVSWFECNRHRLDANLQSLWDRIRPRCGGYTRAAELFPISSAA